MEDLDDIDRQIVAALVRNSRASWRRIADVLGQQERTVARRGNRLLGSKTVRTTGVVNPLAVGADAPFFVTVTAAPREIRSVAAWLAHRPETVWVASLAGSNQCVVELFLPPRRLGDFLYNDLSSMEGVQSFVSAPLFEYYRTLSGWKPDILNEKQYQILHPDEDAGLASLRVGLRPDSLDETNLDLARLLRDNGRATADELSSKVRISKATASRRLESMISSGALFIQAVVDPADLGYGVEALLTITADKGAGERVGQHLGELSATRWAAASDHHVLAQVAVADLGAFQTLLNSLSARHDIQDVQAPMFAEFFKRGSTVIDSHTRAVRPRPTFVGG